MLSNYIEQSATRACDTVRESGFFAPGMNEPWRIDAALPDRTVSLVWQGHSGALRLHLAAVAAPERFSTAWFARHHIDCPPHIVRSVPKRQAEYFAGRLCARDAITALRVHPGHIGTGALLAPSWPAGLTGSISHTQSLAVAIVLPSGACRGIGIDLERVPDSQGINALRAIALNAPECRLIASFSMPAQDVLATAMFSAKESFFKATAATVGHYFDFSAIECVDIGTDTLTCVVRESLSAELTPGMLFRFDFALRGDYVLTSFRW